jgi:ketol-acid reductoisomerase
MMRSSISDTAEYGDYVSGPTVVDERVRERMRTMLAEIQNGSFARRWVAEYESGGAELAAIRARESAQQIETVGAELRSMMRWLQPPSSAPASASFVATAATGGPPSPDYEKSEPAAAAV